MSLLKRRLSRGKSIRNDTANNFLTLQMNLNVKQPSTLSPLYGDNILLSPLPRTIDIPQNACEDILSQTEPLNSGTTTKHLEPVNPTVAQLPTVRNENYLLSPLFTGSRKADVVHLPPFHPENQTHELESEAEVQDHCHLTTRGFDFNPNSPHLTPSLVIMPNTAVGCSKTILNEVCSPKGVKHNETPEIKGEILSVNNNVTDNGDEQFVSRLKDERGLGISNSFEILSPTDDEINADVSINEGTSPIIKNNTKVSNVVVHSPPSGGGKVRSKHLTERENVLSQKRNDIHHEAIEMKNKNEIIEYPGISSAKVRASDNSKNEQTLFDIDTLIAKHDIDTTNRLIDIVTTSPTTIDEESDCESTMNLVAEISPASSFFIIDNDGDDDDKDDDEDDDNDEDDDDDDNEDDFGRTQMTLLDDNVTQA